MNILTKRLKEYFRGKKTLIAGFGKEGKSSADFLDSIGEKYEVYDPFPVTPDEKYVRDFDIILKSPGIPLMKKRLSSELLKRVTCSTNLLLKFSDTPIIGVTGTKGKSTTSTLIKEILVSQGKNASLMGNIGIPALEAVGKTFDVIVLELSCHQLEFVNASPHIGVLLNIYEEHLDHYEDFRAYKKAKENIYNFQKEEDYIILSPELTVKSKSKKIILKEKGNRSAILYNKEAALTAAEIFCNENGGFEKEKAIKAADNFKGLPHRAEMFLTDKNGRKFINDSISTIPEAAVEALLSHNDTDTIIIGGMERGISYSPLKDYLKNRTSALNVIFIPETGFRIEKEINVEWEKTNSFLNIIKEKDLKSAIETGCKITKKCLLFSPAAASYGFFKNFEERGEFFKKTVNRCLSQN